MVLELTTILTNKDKKYPYTIQTINDTLVLQNLNHNRNYCVQS